MRMYVCVCSRLFAFAAALWHTNICVCVRERASSFLSFLKASISVQESKPPF